MISSRRCKPACGAAAAMLAMSILGAPLAHANRVTDDIVGYFTDPNGIITQTRASLGCGPLQVTSAATKAAELANTDNALLNDPVATFAKAGAVVDNAVLRHNWTYSGHGNPEAVSVAVNDAAGFTADCSRSYVGASHIITDTGGYDFNHLVVALAGPVKADGQPQGDDPKDDGKVSVNDRVAIPEGIELNPTTITYSLKALGGSPVAAIPPWANINITYTGEDGNPVTQKNITVGVGYTWTKAVKTKSDPSLTVSANSPGVAGLALECTVTSDSPIVPVNGPSPDKSGTITFDGGLTPVAVKSCG